MHKMAAKKVEELLVATNHALEIDDIADIIELDSIAADISGTTSGEARLLSEPFELCGILFYPLSVAKSLWFSEKCAEWEIEGTQQEALLFWLLSVPNITGELDKYSRRKDAHKAIKRLSRRLHCSSEEMTNVYKKCVGIKMSEDSDKDSNYGGLIECLLREYGGSPEKWLYETPLAMIETLMNNYAARVNAENAANQSGGSSAPDWTDARLKQLRDFRLKSNEIKKKWDSNGEA